MFVKREDMPELRPLQAKGNPFKQKSASNPVLRSSVPGNPFKKNIASPPGSEQAVFGRAVEEKETEVIADPFTTKELSVIGKKKI